MDVQQKHIQDGGMLTSPDSSTPSSSSPVDLVTQILNDEFDDFEKSSTGPRSQQRRSDEEDDNYHLPLFKRGTPSFSGLDFLSFGSDSVGGSTPTSGGSSSDLSPPTGRDLFDNPASNLSDPFTNRNLRRPTGDANLKMNSPNFSMALFDQLDLFSTYPGSLVTDRYSAPKVKNLSCFETDQSSFQKFGDFSGDRSSIPKFNDLSGFETVAKFSGLAGFESDRMSAPKFNGFGSETRNISKFNNLACYETDRVSVPKYNDLSTDRSSVSNFNDLSNDRSSAQKFNGFATETQSEDLDMLNQAISLAVILNLTYLYKNMSIWIFRFKVHLLRIVNISKMFFFIVCVTYLLNPIFVIASLIV